MSGEEIKKEIDRIKRKQIQLESLIAKQEDNGVYDDSLYTQIEGLENDKAKLEEMLEQI